MSRSRKKNASYGKCNWDVFYKRSQKKAERRAVKVSLSKGNWEILPKRKEVSTMFWCGSSYISNEYFIRSARGAKNFIDEASRKNLYILLYKKGSPYDYELEWRDSWIKKATGQGPILNKNTIDAVIDNRMNVPYHEVVACMKDWFPLAGRGIPVDLRDQDWIYLRNKAKRK